MATRSRIGIVLKDDSIRSVYHHWDGYPEWLVLLLESIITQMKRLLHSLMVVTCHAVGQQQAKMEKK